MRRLLALLSLSLVLFVALAANTNSQTTPPAVPEAGYAPGRLLIRFATARAPAMIAETLAPFGATIAAEITPLNVYCLSVPAGQELAIAEQLRRRPDVLYVEPDYILHATLTPNDPYYASQQWNLPHINAPAAWDLTTGAASLTIAIIDTGVDLGHPDLSGKLVAGYDFANNDSDPQDDQGHGSHVAGIAAAATNNGVGVAGVAWGARLMPVKVLDSSGSGYTSAIAQGITWAVDHGARILNLSLGGPNYSSTLADAVAYAYTHNVLVIAAAGNEYLEGNPTSYPAAYPNVLAVAATTDQDSHASYSNTGFYVDISAPGGDPTSSSDTNPRHWIYSTYWRGSGLSYAGSAGTSMAAPHVAGLAALIWSLHPDWTNDQVQQAITATAVDLGAPGRDDVFGYGRINAYAAVLYNPQTPTATATSMPTFTPSPTLTPGASPTPWPTPDPTRVRSRIRLPLALRQPTPIPPPTPTATIAPPTQVALPNGNFEQGRTIWQEFSTHGWPLIVHQGPNPTDLPVPAHSGVWAAWLGGGDNETSYLQQTVTVPATAPYLRFWGWIDSGDVCGYDFAFIRINNITVKTYDLCWATDMSGWGEDAIDLRSYAGQAVTLQVRVETDSSLASSLLVDDFLFSSSAALQAAMPIGSATDARQDSPPLTR